ncbi:MAG: DNA alkylation repair protein [Magnetococcales bacterium]|nr:DNA alkylation repair protein [Magnetococcales bacterium]
MAEPFKNCFNHDLISGMANHFALHMNTFDRAGFEKNCLNGLESLELKERSEHIVNAMVKFLPTAFPDTAKILMASLHSDEGLDISSATTDNMGIAGWAIMPMSLYVAKHGKNHFTLSMNLLREMTKRFSSEFAIRYFIISEQDRSLKLLHEWCKDKNHHVRRLVSEGTRPKLPWAMYLSEFIKDPSPILPLLENLKDDPCAYVRRSVANSINDISKDHPALVVELASRWLQGADGERKKLLRHACRSLIKAGDTNCLKIFGFVEPMINIDSFKVLNQQINMGDSLEFELSFTSINNQDQNLLLDYIIHHVKANGSTTPKVFKWKTIKLAAKKSHKTKRSHKIKPISTRTYYSGKHSVEVVINGKSFVRSDFELTV